jgi:hypothetical protein
VDVEYARTNAENKPIQRHTIERATVEGQSDGASSSRPSQIPNTAKMTLNAMSARVASLRLVKAFRSFH